MFLFVWSHQFLKCNGMQKHASFRYACIFSISPTADSYHMFVIAAVDAAFLAPPASSSRRLQRRVAADTQMKLADDGVLGVGVIGAGRIGLVHLEALSKCENAQAVIISNPTVSKAQAAAEKYKLPAFSGDADDVINHPDVEAVWICSPSSFHADQIKACAAAGKHVFCEKPIATDLEETIEAVRRSQLRTLASVIPNERLAVCGRSTRATWPASS